MFKNNEKGITLVALVITVIVLLILAGIGIAVVTKDNGIINKTQKTKQDIEDVTTDTQTRLNELYSQGTYIDEIYGSIEDLEDINAEYANFRKTIADSIGQAGGESPNYTAASSVYSEKIKGILPHATELNADIAATSNDISQGKKAWVNGQLITGEAQSGGTNATTLFEQKGQALDVNYIFTSDYNTVIYSQGGGNTGSPNDMPIPTFTLSNGTYSQVTRYSNYNSTYNIRGAYQCYILNNVKAGDKITCGKSWGWYGFSIVGY